MRTEPPATCGIAFKEWAGVRDALIQGRQIIVLRKGGILENPAGFQPEHSVFWIYPTHVHEAEQGLKPGERASVPRDAATVARIDTLALVESFRKIHDLDEVLALDDAHVWTEDTIRKRFEYRKPGLWLMVLRILKRREPHSVPIRPEDAGCKTWVPLERPLTADELVPVLDDDAFAIRAARFVTRSEPGNIPPAPEVG